MSDVLEKLLGGMMGSAVNPRLEKLVNGINIAIMELGERYYLNGELVHSIELKDNNHDICVTTEDPEGLANRHMTHYVGPFADCCEEDHVAESSDYPALKDVCAALYLQMVDLGHALIDEERQDVIDKLRMEEASELAAAERIKNKEILPGNIHLLSDDETMLLVTNVALDAEQGVWKIHGWGMKPGDRKARMLTVRVCDVKAVVDRRVSESTCVEEPSL